MTNGSSDVVAAARRFDFVQHTHTYLSQTIASADAKANLFLVVAFGVAAVIASDYTDHRELFAAATGKRYALILAVLSLVWAVGWLLASAWPRLGQSGQGHIYFEHLRQRGSPEQMFRDLNLLDDDHLVRELSAHNFALALIASRKFDAIRFAVIGIAIGLGAALGVYFL